MVVDPHAAEEVVSPFPASISPVAHVRSTVLLGSLGGLKDRGYFDAWSQAIAPWAREEMLHAVAGVWMPVEVAVAHYDACETLPLSTEQQVQLGAMTFARVGGTLLGTVLRMARASGVTPWTVLPHLQRFWERGYDGGGIRVVRLGPKDARIDLVACALVGTRYYRNALRGLTQAVLGLFCQKAYVRERTGGRASQGTLALRAQWA